MNVKRLTSSELRSAIIGMLLGDASLRSTGVNDRIEMSHCLAQLEYLEYKRDIVNQVTGARMSISDRDTYLKKTQKTYPGFCGRSLSTPYFRKIRRLVYNQRGNRAIKADTLKRLTPLGLAIWYMDDGYISIQKKKSRKNPYGGDRYIYDKPHISSRKIKIATHCFSEEEHKIMKHYFSEVWGIDIVIYKPEPRKNPHQRAFYMNATNGNKFLDIVRPYILLPLFEKKIDMKYSGNHQTSGEDMIQADAKSSD